MVASVVIDRSVQFVLEIVHGSVVQASPIFYIIDIINKTFTFTHDFKIIMNIPALGLANSLFLTVILTLLHRSEKEQLL